MTTDEKYSRRKVQNFTQQVQTPLSQKEKIFPVFFIAFPICLQNIEHFQKKDDYPSLVISEIIESERDGYLNVEKFLLQNTIR